MPSIVGRNATKLALCFLLGAISAQRFLLADYAAFASLGFGIIAVATSDRGTKLPLVVASLMTMVDLPGDVYEPTPRAVKYLIYLISLVLILGQVRALRRISWYSGVLLTVILASIFYGLSRDSGTLDSYTLLRDMITILMLIVAILLYTRSEGFDTSILLVAACGVLLSEVCNIAFAYDQASGEYLSYHSGKIFIWFAPMIAMLKRKYAASALLAALAIIVSLYYGSRLVMITGLAVYCAYAVLCLPRRAQIIFLVAGPIIVLLATNTVTSSDSARNYLSSFRIASLQYAMSNIGDVPSYYEAIDPTRYAENKIFFEQPLPQILLGNGPGSGLIDTHGHLDFLEFDSSAFTNEEMAARTYFRLHDSWTWFGVRFGLLSYVLCVLPMLFFMFRASKDIKFLAACFLLVLLNSSFSIAGLFSALIFAVAILNGNRIAGSQLRIEVNQATGVRRYVA